MVELPSWLVVAASSIPSLPVRGFSEVSLLLSSTSKSQLVSRFSSYGAGAEPADRVVVENAQPHKSPGQWSQRQSASGAGGGRRAQQHSQVLHGPSIRFTAAHRTYFDGLYGMLSVLALAP
ncbi:hypothetical protein EVAR_100006_1 [Eumeta japonica]|uniref:Uncharacterized protein n=1 Tax=Eumeta variegata TaxID=151549 RepID=A0A4C2A3B9_EUMVA|nr:hypothetical protein EVAR_100006_1 [Eumeta japonica]